MKAIYRYFLTIWKRYCLPWLISASGRKFLFSHYPKPDIDTLMVIKGYIIG
jgi:hypothetical protein